MSKRQLLAFFVCSLVPWTIGNGMAPLVTVHAVGLGASQAMAGTCLSLSYLCLAAGTLAAGWLSGRVRRLRGPTLAAGLVSTPALYLMGRAETVWALAALLGVWFFCAGIVGALNAIAAGVSAESSQRGRVFGLLALAAELGALLGGPLGGPIADRYGFGTMYAVMALLNGVGPLVAALRPECSLVPTQTPARDAAGKRSLGSGFWALFGASLVASLAGYVFFAGRSFVMAGQGFSRTALSSAGMVAAAVALPTPLVAGWLSDRLGRKRFLAISFAATASGLLLLAAAGELWHFWAASALYTLSFMAGPVGNALASDLLPPHSLGKGLALYGVTSWLGGIAGCTLTGVAMQSLGTMPTLFAGALLPLVAIGLLASIAAPRRTAAVARARAEVRAPAEPAPAPA